MGTEHFVEPVKMSHSSLQDAFVAVQPQDGEFNWCVSAAGEFVSNATSGMGLETLKEALRDDAVQFGTIKVLGVDEQQSVTSTRSKLCNFQWIGPNVKPMKKIQALQGKDAAARVLTGPACNLELSERAELNSRYIGKDLLRVGGAHKPTHYDFGAGDSVSITSL